MAKKSTGYTPTGRNKTSPTEKMSSPMKATSMKPQTLPMPISTPTATASMPGTRQNMVSKPPKLQPRTPRI